MHHAIELLAAPRGQPEFAVGGGGRRDGVQSCETRAPIRRAERRVFAQPRSTPLYGLAFLFEMLDAFIKRYGQCNFLPDLTGVIKMDLLSAFRINLLGKFHEYFPFAFGLPEATARYL